jgi:SAM-dependent methyltransferase
VTAVTGSIAGSGSGSRGLDPVTRRPAGADESRRANRAWWDGAADDYQAEHGSFLGESSLIWGPEGLDEAEAALLGPTAGRRVLEVGCGAAAGSRWLRGQGARCVGVDLSLRQLQHSRRLDAETGVAVPTACADAASLPLASQSVDLAFSAYGALPFVADAGAVLSEVARVLRPAGRWVFSVTHPSRWSFRDDPGPGGLTAERSYFDRRAYVEQDERGVATYVEHHRTLGDWVRLLDTAGFRLHDLVEPEWPAGLDLTWGGWSPLRGRILPGTAIFCSHLAP